jgi:hypothetical protein
MDITQIIALSMGAAWASGINLYAAILMLGYMGTTGNIDLPPDLQVLSNPMGVDTGWDALSTFIRIPAGAILAAGAVGDVGSGAQLAAAIAGGTLATGSHITKAGTRVLINTSPEPVTNWFASVGEDVAVIAGLWTALYHPALFLVLLVLFILLSIWLLPKIWRGIKKVFGFLGNMLGSSKSQDPPAPVQAQALASDTTNKNIATGNKHEA